MKNAKPKNQNPLKLWRARRQLTQLQAAQKMEVELDTWQNWEQGRNRTPKYFLTLLEKS